MAMTEALKKAQKKYSQSTQWVQLRFSKDKDADIIKILDEKENKTDYIRQLIRRDNEK